MATELGQIFENKEAKVLAIHLHEKDVGLWIDEDPRGSGGISVDLSYPLFYKLYRNVLSSQGVEIDFQNPKEKDICLFGKNIMIRQKEIFGIWSAIKPSMPWFVNVTNLPLIAKTEN